jgi:TetR/AcrR family transcriptional repressor of nem operon
MPWEKQFDVNEVLEKAMQAFWSRGYQGTSMQDLVACMGINRGSLYSTYRDKHALFLAALRTYDETLRYKRLAELESNNGPREAIRHLFLAFISHVSEKGGNRGCFLTNTALELAAHDPEARKIVAHAQREIEAFFSRMITKGKAEGNIAPHVRPEETASGLLASLIGLVVLTRSRPEQALLQAIVDDALMRLD